MVEKSLVVGVEPGIQADIAAQFVREASQFIAEVFLEKKGRRINAKSIMGVLSLAIARGETITLFIDGPDEQEAINALTAFLTEEK
ncbi:HPr family phosphocarrier protein [Amphibacillus sp. MSJ-3]|uniref:HPr family phosphocarrier protein n=1 Tax=Amphibacillus sp. MSJ-3 TaxID=2841505 RepID=UPI001C0F121D|nr:HPr family phosphocarrier protein [Amphibacillus sp. MSJ-3]MBU5593992.1 HPr family phosphocarrier protein [Amphibacillus sp. MSJ-3]